MEDIRLAMADLLQAWREATRAAQLAATLAAQAAAATEDSDADTEANEHLVALAQETCDAAERAAKDARACLERAEARGNAQRDRLPEAQQASRDADAREGAARERYNHSARQADAASARG